MKIIFLDIDGVLLTRRTMIATGRNWSAAEPDRVLCQTLIRCCEKGDVRIVVSSTWRDTPIKCRAKLKEGGLLNCLHKSWATPLDTQLSPGGIYIGVTRGLEISAWLLAHPTITDFRILDDEEHDFKTDPEFYDKLLLCDTNNGADYYVMARLVDWAGAERRMTCQQT